MGGFLLSRVLDGIVKLFIVSVILYLMLVVLPPGNPAAHLAGKQQDPGRIKLIEHQFCFDKGNVGAYLCFMKKTLTGNFTSPSQGDVNVFPRAVKAIPVTFGLALFASVIWMAAGMFAGITGARTKNVKLDRTLMIVALIGISFPTAWLALLLLMEFTAKIPIFPPGGYMGIFSDGAFNYIRSMTLPALTLAIVNAGVYTRMTRTTVRQKMREEYIKTAEAKGLPAGRVFTHHVMRTAMIPIVVMFGVDFSLLMGGAVFTESIFGLPGLGEFLIEGMHSMDFAMLFIGGLFAAGFVIVSNTIVDLVQAMLDPKLRTA